MRNFTLILVFLAVGFGTLLAQSYNTSTDQLLDGLQEKYGKEDNYAIDFVMTIMYPEQDAIEQKGKYFSQEDNYRINMPDQKIICNGQKQWVWDLKNNYVQIYSATEDAVFSPRGIFDMLHSDQYAYAMIYEGMKGGKLVKQMEFKPNDRFTDLGKARLSLNGEDHSIEKLELFYKDATRIVLELTNVSKTVVEDSDFFSFQKEKHPGVTVDDLRLE